MRRRERPSGGLRKRIQDALTAAGFAKSVYLRDVSWGRPGRGFQIEDGDDGLIVIHQPEWRMITSPDEPRRQRADCEQMIPQYRAALAAVGIAAEPGQDWRFLPTLLVRGG